MLRIPLCDLPEMTKFRWILLLTLTLQSPLAAETISLNGVWDIAEGNRFEIPERFEHTVPVPGLVKLATPSFADVGSLQSKTHRQAFWYRTRFEIDAPVPTSAVLRIGKAKYGTRVYLNGHEVGEELACFTKLEFDVAPYLKGNGERNELLVCLGHWIDSIPVTHPVGFDREKLYYFPGIYDDVSLELSGSPHVEKIQLVPLPSHGSVRVVAQIGNLLDASRQVHVEIAVSEKASGQRVGEAILKDRVEAGQTKQFDTTISIENSRLWSPEDPFLYELQASTGADEQTETFGLRDFRFDAATGRPMLNGKPYYLRGTNICIFRFMDDEACENHPWNETWVRKFIRSLKEMNWNSARYCIGFPPELWYRIADEEGLLIQDEFPLWTFRYARYGKPLRGEEGGEISVADEKLPEFEQNLTAQAKDWMAQRWNHPSVVIWDIQNETVMTDVTGNVINAVRDLDLSDRPWDNGESPMQRATDPLELHIYPFVFPSKWPKLGIPPFEWSHIPRYKDVPLPHFKPERIRGDYPPIIVNEYVALWTTRDGASCTHSVPHFERILGDENTAENRWRMNAESVAKLTELLRCHWRVAGVMQFCALGYSRRDAIFLEGATCDFMIDVDNIVFHPYYQKVVSDAFAPVGIMLDEWACELPAGARHTFKTTLVNDLHEDWQGRIRLSIAQNGNQVNERTVPAEVKSLAQTQIEIGLTLPSEEGKYVFSACLDGPDDDQPCSFRRIKLVAP